MSGAAIGRRRLASQGIEGVARRSPADVVAALGAMQAQDYLGALWAIGLRSPGATEASVERAIAERRIVRTWPMRGTLHFVAAADVRWMLALLTPRVIARSAPRRRQLGLDEKTLARGETLIRRALHGGRSLTREALLGRLDAGGVSTAGQRGYHILGTLAQRALLCFGPRSGREHTFVLLDDWLPRQRVLEREAALAELARRYFTGHGPAAVEDFAWWSGLRLTEAREALALAGPALASERDGSRTLWSAAGAARVARSVAAVHLLPGFDEFLLGYKERADVLEAGHRQAIVPGNNGMFMPMIVAAGRVAGTWRRTLSKRAVEVAVSPFAPLPGAQARAVAAEAARYRRFLAARAEDDEP